MAEIRALLKKLDDAEAEQKMVNRNEFLDECIRQEMIYINKLQLENKRIRRIDKIQDSVAKEKVLVGIEEEMSRMQYKSKRLQKELDRMQKRGWKMEEQHEDFTRTHDKLKDKISNLDAQIPREVD
jgi:predicted  nucleic acid-binding Zn-ribbon protein